MAAEGEYQAAVKLGEAADIITRTLCASAPHPPDDGGDLGEKNSTIIFPAQFMTTVQDAIALMAKESASESSRGRGLSPGLIRAISIERDPWRAWLRRR